MYEMITDILLNAGPIGALALYMMYLNNKQENKHDAQQMQYLNNIELAHYRSHFEDNDDPEKKRHLFRTWHRERGLRNYDG